MSQVIFSTDALQLDAGQVLDSPAAHQDNMMLLQIVSNSRNICDRLTAGAQPNADTLSICRVGLLRLPNQRLQDDALQEWSAIGGALPLSRLFVRTVTVQLPEIGRYVSLERGVMRDRGRRKMVPMVCGADKKGGDTGGK